MDRLMFKSKIHRATVTDANLNYEGSITLDRELMQAADILPYEQVHIVNVNNGERLVTYAIEGGPGEICLNGAAARKASPGDVVIVITYAQVPAEQLAAFRPTVVQVDAKNRIVATHDEVVAGTVFETALA
ncbi:MAG TPA: aspartate 1-decarboxylase [Candidatus Dormibacteraeota bacterium]|nr:aspartate 1-decarboxylase [Candidatus Dormibacteraeota bacterium]